MGQDDRVLRAGILGYGYMGTLREATLTERADCEIAHIFHPEPGPVHRAATWEEVVEDPAVDCNFVCLPNHLSCEVVCRALDAGKHVFAEKPPGLCVAEVERMIAAESASGRVLKFGFNHRYHPAIRHAEKIIASGELGEVRWVRGRYGKSGAVTGWRADKERAGGGILMDQGIHMLDLLRMLCGDFDQVHAFAQGGPVEEELVAILRNDGQVATLHSSNTQHRPLFSLEVGLTRGLLSVNGLLSRTGRYGPERLDYGSTLPNGESQSRTYSKDDSWALEVEAFFAAIRNGAPVGPGSTAEALALMTLVEAIYAAAGR